MIFHTGGEHANYDITGMVITKGLIISKSPCFYNIEMYARVGIKLGIAYKPRYHNQLPPMEKLGTASDHCRNDQLMSLDASDIGSC